MADPEHIVRLRRDLDASHDLLTMALALRDQNLFECAVSEIRATLHSLWLAGEWPVKADGDAP